MKVLILSSSPWSVDNSFGNSYTNIFGGIKHIEFANVYCRHGSPKNDIVKRQFQITEKLLINNLLFKSEFAGREVFRGDETDELTMTEQKLFDEARKIRLQIFFWARQFVWKVGRWQSPELKKFISDFNPDIIFQPLYYSAYMNDIALFIKDFTNVPMVSYAATDVYTLRRFSLSPLFWIDRLNNRTKVKKVVEKSEYLYVISDIQKQDYQRIFKKECKLLTKGADFSGKPDIKKEYNFPLKFVYTGIIGGGRWKSLVSLGKQLEKLNRENINAQLFIYSMTPMTKKMSEQLDIQNTVFFMGEVEFEKINKIQTDADVLVHVEPTDLAGRLAVRHAFSTKIVDYFHRGRCIFAVGPKEVASIDHLIKNDAAIVATDENEIMEQLKRVIDNSSILTEYAKKAWECGKKNHDIANIQKNLYEDLKLLVDVRN